MNKVLILDFGSQYTKLIAKQIRNLNVYCEVLPYNISYDKICKFNPNAIIFSGGPSSVYDKKAYEPSDEILKNNIPVLGICYGMQYIAKYFGSKVVPGGKKEFGESFITIQKDTELTNKINWKKQVWMSHSDEVTNLSKELEHIADSENSIAIIKHKEKPYYGIQFHLEVDHTLEGQNIMKNFLFKVAKIKPDWKISNFVKEKIIELQKLIGDKKVILALSGGVDSAVCAVLLSKAIGKNLICIFVDNGLLRLQDFSNIKFLKEHFNNLNIKTISAANVFYKQLNNVVDPEKKRKIIGKLFIDIFEKEAKKIKNTDFLAQGTIYSDVIESAKNSKTAHTIKSHHNVGGLPEKLNLKIVEPLRELLKDEVRKVGRTVGLPDKFVNRQPFPGPGLAIRIIGSVNVEKIKALQMADQILNEEFEKNNLYKKTSQAFVVCTDTKSVGVMGDFRTYKNLAVIRCVNSNDFMTANVSEIDWNILKAIAKRIVNEVPYFNRVAYDITTKPPATIEWE